MLRWGRPNRGRALTRGKGGINKESMHAFIDGLEVPDAIKAELKAVTPQNYTGIPFSLPE